jgi:hypothetical protein
VHAQLLLPTPVDVPSPLQIYRDKLRADAVDDSLQNRRQNLQEYVKDWFLNRHGMPRLAQVRWGPGRRGYTLCGTSYSTGVQLMLVTYLNSCRIWPTSCRRR